MTDTQKRRHKEQFRNRLAEYLGLLKGIVSTEKGDWVVKGFIDVAANIYTISVDTKVVSKILELLLFPKICEFAERYGYRMVLSQEQNFYPDISFIESDEVVFALDLKSTYRKTRQTVNGMTLGAFTGYFRNRSSTKNITFPYQQYLGHFVLGVIYSQVEERPDERQIYQLKDLSNIASVIHSFEFFLQEKYRIAVDRPGSGNTKNIGSVVNIRQLVEGRGPFAELGESVFDDYWMNYLTNDMARAVDLEKPPYRNLKEYQAWKQR